MNRKFDRDEAVSLYKAGFGVHVIAKQLGVTSGPVWRSLRHLVEMRSQDKRTVDENEVKDMYTGGLSAPQIAKKLNISTKIVFSILKKYEIPTRKIGEARSIRAKEKIIDSNGYIRIRIGKRKYRLEHRMIAEKALGRNLKRHECVHHINCIRTDNRNENLLICSVSYHNEIHGRMNKHPYWSKFS